MPVAPAKAGAPWGEDHRAFTPPPVVPAFAGTTASTAQGNSGFDRVSGEMSVRPGVPARPRKAGAIVGLPG